MRQYALRVFFILVLTAGQAGAQSVVDSYKQCLSNCMSQLDGCIARIMSQAQSRTCGARNEGCIQALSTTCDAGHKACSQACDNAANERISKARQPPASECGALPGDRIPVQCTTGPIGKNCSCLPVSNTCPYTIQVTFRLSGISGTSSMPVSRNGTNRTDACTSRPGQTIEYVGWKKQ